MKLNYISQPMYSVNILTFFFFQELIYLGDESYNQRYFVRRYSLSYGKIHKLICQVFKRDISHCLNIGS